MEDILTNNALININGGNVDTLSIIILMTLLSLLPSLIIMMTSFTRIVIVLSILRNAMGLQQTPPNLVLIGIAIFLSIFIMTPTFSDINEEAYQPYVRGELSQMEALEAASIPMKEFMLQETKTDSLNTFLEVADRERPETQEELTDLPLNIIIPAFMSSELSRAFTMGFFLFLPFLVIDIIVASTLMSMGMFMLPPAMISLPFKLLLFVIVNGWDMLFSTLVSSFY